ncbi:hypothetical protein HPB51_024728 [Rhipicephalus microplus]|uniref:PKS/mFAS DH domain-containing protein n=1 Tax=Rhipicephalus microplus TaxID=6941 RepID=A0A9J6EVI3_RHIMP|nr:hypothetical protein HPB51_024728 [Rhipicephalus microplus]
MAEDIVEIDIEANEADRYLSGHQVDGRNLYPAMGYLVLVWKSVAKRMGMPIDQVPVVFEDVSFRQASLLPKNGCVRFLVNVLRLTGEFEVATAGAAVATGRVRVIEEGERLLVIDPPCVPGDSVDYELQAQDVYKELRLRGYGYHGAFQGILKADIDSLDVIYDGYQKTCRAGGVVVKGLRNTLFERRLIQQVPQLEKYHFVPYIDDDEMKEQRYRSVKEYVKNSTDNDSLLNVLLTLSKGTSIPTYLASSVRSLLHDRRKCLERDILNTALFTEDPLRCLLDVVLENTGFGVVQVLELAAKKNSLLLAPWALQWLSLQDIRFKIKYAILHPSPEDLAPNHVPDGASIVKYDSSSAPQKRIRDAELTIVVRGVFDTNSNTNSLLKHLSQCKEKSFVLLSQRTELTPAEMFLSSADGTAFRRHSDDEVIAAFKARGLLLVGLKSNSLSSLLLFRNCSTASEICKQAVITVKNSGFKWVEKLRKKVLEYDMKPDGENIWILAQDAGTSGILGLTNNLIEETGGRRVRCVFDATPNGSNDVFDFSPSNLNYADALQQDLLMNVSRNGQWGSYKYLSFTSDDLQKTTTTYAFLNIRSRGDLSSFHWCESPLSYASLSSIIANGGMLCDVYCAPLNFHDILLATGKIAPEALPGKWAFSDCVMGLEFSGRDDQGRRIMCMARSQGIATVAIADPDFTWDVPETWTLEDACTVPIAYTTAYYALIMRGNMRPGETVLVHSGSGGVGQAAIAIALSMGCTVYTTVGKWAFSDCVMGLEFSGRDDQGRRIMCMARSQGIATVAIADPDFTWDVPETWTLENACTVPIAYSTAYYALIMRGNMRPGETVLVHSGSGGVGQAAIAIALSMGCTVYTTVGKWHQCLFHL